MDDHYYEVCYCPFCGAEMEPEENYGVDEE